MGTFNIWPIGMVLKTYDVFIIPIFIVHLNSENVFFLFSILTVFCFSFFHAEIKVSCQLLGFQVMH